MTGGEIAAALAAHLGTIPDCRVHAYMPDAFQPPGIVIGQPSISWEEGTRTFCARYWSFPLSLVVTRTHDRSAQDELDRLLTAIEEKFSTDPAGDITFARLVSASPQSISSQGVEYPGYEITVEVIA